MKVVSLALLYLGSVSFFGVDASKWFVRVNRDRTKEEADASKQSLIHTQNVKGEPIKVLQIWRDISRIRVKRRPQEISSLRSGCKLGTCNLHNLANTLYHLTDKDKDISAPPHKVNAYGRRRRSLALLVRG